MDSFCDQKKKATRLFGIRKTTYPAFSHSVWLWIFQRMLLYKTPGYRIKNLAFPSVGHKGSQGTGPSCQDERKWKPSLTVRPISIYSVNSVPILGLLWEKTGKYTPFKMCTTNMNVCYKDRLKINQGVTQQSHLRIHPEEWQDPYSSSTAEQINRHSAVAQWGLR